MYDELVKRLREDAPTALANCDFDFIEGWIKEAADAIEEMSRQLAEYHSYDGFLLMHGCFVDPPEPPKEE